MKLVEDQTKPLEKSRFAEKRGEKSARSAGTPPAVFRFRFYYEGTLNLISNQNPPWTPKLKVSPLFITRFGLIYYVTLHTLTSQ